MRSRRSILRAILAVLLLLTLLACAEGEPGGEAPEPIRIDLLERLDFAQKSGELRGIGLTDAEAEGRLTSGWHRHQEDSGGGFRWTGRRDAVIEIPVVTPSDLRVRLEITPVQDLLRIHPDSPRQTLGVLWNGNEIATIPLELDAGPVEFEVPATLQRVGPNRLELLPSYWITPRWHLLGDDGRSLGLRVESIALLRERAIPDASPLPTLAPGGGISQPAGSLVTWYFALPEQARLVGTARLSEGVSGQLTLSLLDMRSQETRLLEGVLSRDDPSLSVDADLSRYAGEMVAISLAFDAPPGGAPAAGARVRWEALRIEGIEPPARTQAPGIWRAPYNVFMVLFDSLRADHTEPYGSTRVRTPTLQALAQRGVTFVNTYSNSAWTRPAVASMLTSLYPSSHGVEKVDQKLSPEPPYLPELLKRYGYATVAVSNTVVISPPFGMARGFDEMHLYWEVRKQHAAAGNFSPESEARFVWDRFLEPVVARAEKQPFFAYLHEVDPHSPYEPASPYREMYDHGHRANFNLTFDTAGFVRFNPLWVDPMDVEYLRAGYLGEISFMDRYLGDLLEALERQGVAEDTLVIFVSDHGEEFWDHRSLGHGGTVYDELLRVPLILSLPGVLPEGRRPQVDAQLLDVAPTVLDLLGLPIPDGMQGESLLPYVRAPETERPVKLSAGDSEGAGFQALRYGDWKLIRENPSPGKPGHPQYALFDLRNDPEEIVDVFPQELVVGHTLRQMLEEHLAQATGAAGERLEGMRRTDMDEALIRALKALGYAK